MSEKRKDKKGRVLKDGEIQKPDGRYEFRYTDRDGIRRSVYSWKLNETDKVPVGKKDDISLREKEERIHQNIKDSISDRGQRVTIRELFEEALKTKANIKPSTRYRYIETFNYYILPHIGDCRIGDLKYSDITGLYRKLHDELGVKGSTIKNAHSILHWMFDHAVLTDYVRKNIVTGASKAIKADGRKIRSMTLEEQMRFVECLNKSGASEVHKDFVRFMLWTGCRISEAAGVRWEDCDMENRTISIKRILSYNNVNDPDRKYRYCVSTTKTGSSNRTIPMSDSLYDMLERRKILGRRSTMEFGDIIFCNSNGMPYTERETIKYLDRIVSKNNRLETKKAQNPEYKPLLLPKISPHSLRHTFCSRLCEVESNIKSIQEIMGHSDVTTTLNIYAESNQMVMSDTMRKLDNYTTRRTTNDG